VENHHRMDALPKFLFGGESLATQSPSELKRGLIVDAICVLLLLLGLAGAAFGQSQDPPKDQKQQGQQSSNQSAPQATPVQPQQEDSVPEAARKAKLKKAKKVYSEEDLAGLKGGVSVVGDPNVQSSAKSANSETVAAGVPEQGTIDGKSAEQTWRGQAAQIHSQMDATDEQVKALKEDIKKNGSSGFNAQKGLRDNVVYLDDKTARVQQLEGKKKKLEQALDDLQEQGRKAGIPPEWVR